MITVDGLTIEFSGTTLFKDISFQINEKDRIALMGKNGAGKSTFLRSSPVRKMLLLKSPDVLLLDEPTNHLDLKTKDVLKQALLDFDGTLIVVSHDRDFLDGLVSKVYEFGHGRVREHLCGIYEFLESKKMENLQELEKKQ